MVRQTVDWMRIGSFLKSAVLSAVMFGASALAAQATTFNGIFSLSGSAYVEPGLVIDTSVRSGTMGFTLDVGDSVTFDLFDIWDTERRVNGNNTRQSSLVADFTFASLGTSGTATGTTAGHATNPQYVSLVWGGPVMLNFGNGGLLSIALTDEQFAFGVGGLNVGAAGGATVQAIATYIAAPVPLPASGLLLVAAIGAAAVLRRRRNAA